MTAPSDTLDLAAMRAAAEVATQGPWDWGGRFGSDGAGQTLLCSDTPLLPDVRIWWRYPENRAFSETWSPARALALLRRLEAAEAVCEALETYMEMLGAEALSQWDATVECLEAWRASQEPRA